MQTYVSGQHALNLFFLYVHLLYKIYPADKITATIYEFTKFIFNVSQESYRGNQFKVTNIQLFV